MINFVVMEDNDFHLKNTKKIINRYMMKNDYEYTITSFSGLCSEFYNVIMSDENKIYILDFELDKTNAIEVAREIRKVDWRSPIIVFSVNGGMAYDTFKQRLQILDFVNKQFEAEKNLFELFDICLKQLKIKDSLKYNVGKVTYSLDYDNIYYVYRDTYERKTVIVTNNGEYKISTPLFKVKEKLSKSFAYSHKSCIVNMSKVVLIDWPNYMISFDNGAKINLLSRSHKKDLKDYALL